MHPITGLVPAVFTPLKSDCSLNLALVPRIVEHLVNNAIGGLYVCGSTGEGPLLTLEERRAVATAYIEAAAGRIPVMVQVGHESTREAAALARHAANAGATAISAVPPVYFKPASVPVLVDTMKEIAGAVPELPFYYYHIPALSAVALDMERFLELAKDVIPNLAGIKFSSPRLDELQACRNFEGGRFDILFGVDEMLLCGLASGAKGAVGSTYNFLAPLYNEIIRCYDEKKTEEAEALQAQVTALVRVMIAHRGLPAIKTCMKLIGLDCGPTRLPLQTLDEKETAALKEDLERLGFFDWATLKQ